MDANIYSSAAISRFMKKNVFFNDVKLKHYYDTDNVSAFRQRVHEKFPDKSFEKIVYVVVTDTLRDIILNVVGELTTFMEPMGEMIISGGEAFNLYVDVKNRVITSDIDTKFVPNIPYNTKYFGHLQAIKLMMWNKLGEISRRISDKVIRRFTERSKLAKFLGLKCTGPVSRRFTLLPKSKTGLNTAPSTGDVFIDVELFALDLGIRYFSISKNVIEGVTLGGILDIPFMRPGEFGYELIQTKKRGITYIDHDTGRFIRNNKVFVASKEFLLNDIYLMQKLGLRPEKKEKNRERIFKLAKQTAPGIKKTDSIENIFRAVSVKTHTPHQTMQKASNFSINAALRINPQKYRTLTTTPNTDRLGKQIVYGLKTSADVTINGFKKTHGDEKFNINHLVWKKARGSSYVKNEYNQRSIKPLQLPATLNIPRTLYGFNPKRDAWMPKKLVEKAAMIPFVGLKNKAVTYTE